ncbi:DNA polymerase zeta, partial [Physocladia obscura]
MEIRIINIDFALTRPVAGIDLTHSAFAYPSVKFPRVPVIRVFGATSAGQKIFPYFYVPYDGPLDSKSVYRFIYQLGRSINHAMAISLRIPSENTFKTQFVAAIILVKGIPFYGFHAKYSYFIKIYLTDPGLLNRVIELLSKGVVMGKCFQTYESHIPYLPQFFIDHNLLGMDYLKLANFRIRKPLPKMSFCENISTNQIFNDRTTSQSLIWPESMSLERESFCELELDAVAGDILNRTEILERPRKPLIDLTRGTEIFDTKLVPSLKSLWEDESRRRAIKNLSSIPSTAPQESNKPLPKTQQTLLNSLYALIEQHKLAKVHKTQNTQDSGDSETLYNFPKFEHDAIPTIFSAVSALYFGGQIITKTKLTASQAKEDNASLSYKVNSEVFDGEEIIYQMSQAFDRIREESARLSENVAAEDRQVEDSFIEVDEFALTQNIEIKDVETYVEELEAAAELEIDDENMQREENMEEEQEEEEEEDDDDEDEEEEEEEDEEQEEEGGGRGGGEDNFDDEFWSDQNESHENHPPSTLFKSRKGKEKFNGVHEDIDDMETLLDNQKMKVQNFTSDEKDQEFINEQVLTFQTFEKQQIFLELEAETIRKKYSAESIHFALTKVESRGQNTGNLDQVDGPSSPTVDQNKKKRVGDQNSDDIEDSDEETNRSSKQRQSQLRRSSLKISLPPDPPKKNIAKKSVSFTISSNREDQRFKPVPKLRTSNFEEAKLRAKKSTEKILTLESLSTEIQQNGLADGEISISESDFSAVKNFNTKLLPDSNVLTFDLVTSQLTSFEENKKTFISKLDQMWSPKATEFENWSFFHDPPIPISPKKFSSLEPNLLNSLSQGSSNKFNLLLLPGSQLKKENFTESTLVHLKESEHLNNQSFSHDMHDKMPENNNQEESEFSSIMDTLDLAVKSISQTPPKAPRLLTVFRLKSGPPTLKHLYGNWESQPERIYKDPYFSNTADVSRGGVKIFSSKQFKLHSETDLSHVADFSAVSSCKFPVGINVEISLSMESLKTSYGLDQNSAKSFVLGIHHDFPVNWTLAKGPPSRKTVEKWIQENPDPNLDSMTQEERILAQKGSQLEAPTPKNKFGYKYSQIRTEALNHELQHLISMSVEILTCSMTEADRVLAKLPKIKLPDPKSEAVIAIFYCFQGHTENSRHRNNGHRSGYHVGAIIVGDNEDDELEKPMPFRLNGISGYPVETVETEIQLLHTLVAKIREFDPDILLGYEVHLSSWGYLIERANLAYEYDLLKELSRMNNNVKTKFGRERDPFSYEGTCSIACSGRIFLNVWRLMRKELTLTNYSLENTVFHVLHRRTPKFSPATLYSWYFAKGLKRWRSLAYYIERVQFSLDLLDETSFLARSCEFARVYGMDLFSVISRGSQFRVESILSRITRPENFVQLSPTKEQVRKMRAIECMPLILEPKTKFYKNPMAVLDFQSLYPSVMIGYNICYSTCLGRLKDLGEPKQFGAMDLLEIPMDIVEALKDHLYVTHNGVVFVKSHVREGTLGRMLKEILETRVMVKASMILYKNDPGLLRILEARQLGLKLVANVTYGYCGASFSGRMPCAEIADSIVETGRRSLESCCEILIGTLKAMKMVADNFNEWGGTIVYGDTDSMFVELPNRSLESAFQIGMTIADYVSIRNPIPMKLKFEKIYLPSVLLAKKRYVGFMYETPDDIGKPPIFDAKGIETVRRDGFPAMSKIVEDSLKILFRDQDMSELKEYLYRQWDKIMTNRVELNDLIIATEFKLKNYR